MSGAPTLPAQQAELMRIADKLDRATSQGSFTDVCLYAAMATNGIRTLASGVTQPSEPAGGIEQAARWVDDRREQFEREHGILDPETNSMEFRQLAQHEYAAELCEIADGIRALATPPTGEPLTALQWARMPTLEQHKWLEQGNAHPMTAGDPLTAPSDGYMEAFYELGKLMGIPAQPTSPERVWREQMLPRLRAALAATAMADAWAKGYRTGRDDLCAFDCAFDEQRHIEPNLRNLPSRTPNPYASLPPHPNMESK